MPGFERLAADRGLWMVEDACEALGAVHADGTRGGRARQPGHVRLLPQQAAGHGRGRRPDQPRRGLQGARRQRAQPGPRARHGLARPRPAGLQLPAVRRWPARSGWPSSSAWTRCWPAGRAWRALYGQALAGVEGLELPCPDAGGDRRSWFVYVVQLPAGRRPRRHHPRAARAGHRLQALPAGDPPDELLPRALRPPRGPVPGVRGRGRALAGAAVLPGDDRGPGPARGRSRWPRATGRAAP